jgi:hypothetical protein
VALHIATTLAPPAATIATTRTLALTLVITILPTITTLGGTPDPILIPALGLAILSPAALARTATTPTAAAVISPIPITSLHLGTGAGRPNTSPETGLGLLQTKHRPRGLDQHLHLEFIFSYTEPIQGSFLCFI